MDWFICNCMCITSTVYSLPGPVLPRHGFCWRSAESTGNTLSLPSSLHPSLTSYLHPSSCHSFIHRFILPSLSPIPHLSFHILSFLHSFTPIIPPVTSLSINSFLSNSFHYPSSLHPYSSPYLCFTPSLFFLTSDLILYFLILSLINWLSYSPSPSSLTHFLSLFPHSLPLTPSHSSSAECCTRGLQVESGFLDLRWLLAHAGPNGAGCRQDVYWPQADLQVQDWIQGQ